MQAPSPSAISELVLAFIRNERADRTGPGLDAQTDLIETGILDSLFLMQLVSHLEQQFAVELNPDAITPENFLSVDRIVALVATSRAVR